MYGEPVEALAQPTLIFASSFATATGTGANAISDGGKWPIDGGQGHNIIANPGNVGFPAAMPNLFSVDCKAVNDGFCLLRTTDLGIPTRPFTRYYRWYFRLIKTLDTDGTQHPIQDGNSISDSNWTLNVNQIDDDTWRASFEGGATQRFNHVDSGIILDTHHTYRFEISIENLNTTDFRMHVRVYNESGTLVLDDEDLEGEVSPNPMLSSNPTLTYANEDVSPGAFTCGNNGWNDMAVDQTHSYQSGFAVSDEDWCGPYVDGEETI